MEEYHILTISCSLSWMFLISGALLIWGIRDQRLLGMDVGEENGFWSD